MLHNNYFEHDGPNETWDARIARYLDSPLTGEDIAWGQGSYGSPAGIVSQWMHSPTHRAIILTAALHRIGLGLAPAPTTAPQAPPWQPPTSPPNSVDQSGGFAGPVVERRPEHGAAPRRERPEPSSARPVRAGWAPESSSGALGSWP